MRNEYFVPATRAIAFTMKKGQIVRIIDVAGEQVADVVAYRSGDYSERLDPSVTMDALRVYKLGKNDVLYTNKYRPMFTIVEDTVECHDLFNSACRSEMYEFLYEKSNHRSCYGNLNEVLEKYEVPIPDQHYTVNFFMNTALSPNGRVAVERPLSKAGDYVSLRAEMDVVVGVSACPCEESVVNGFTCTPLRIEIC
ncbi:hypothetical protein AAC03nite_28470 [Alicyclobacillus acidoterrestris]|nr:hypothetical protein AAC03nite_28470 [Alicyclobacillus acidoterrestris]